MKEERELIVWKLKILNLTHGWLISMLERRGVYVTKEGMSVILRGLRKTGVAIEAISKSMEIIKEYEAWLATM